MKRQFWIHVGAVLSGCLLFGFTGQALARPGYFDSCKGSGCHDAANLPITCAGCHAHGTHSNYKKDDINLVATTIDPANPTQSKLNFHPDEVMGVKIVGGYYDSTSSYKNWVRVLLYDEKGNLIACSTGPNAVEPCRGKGNGYPLSPSSSTKTPLTLTKDINGNDLKAPLTPGDYKYSIAWYGSVRDQNGAVFNTDNPPSKWNDDSNNPNHGTQTVWFSFKVIPAGRSASEEISKTETVSVARQAKTGSHKAH